MISNQQYEELIEGKVTNIEFFIIYRGNISWWMNITMDENNDYLNKHAEQVGLKNKIFK